MNRYLKCFLSALLTGAVLTSCAVQDPAGQSADISEEASSETSAEVQDPVYEGEVPVVLSATSLSSVDRSVKGSNLAYGKTYTYSETPSSDYPDGESKKLTDGVIKSGFDRENWVGFLKCKEVNVTLDLGEKQDGIADITIGILVNQSYGIGAPYYVNIFVSDDGTDFRKLGTVYPDRSDGKQDVGLRLKDAVSCRYVRYEVSTGSSVWVFLGEVYALRYDNGVSGSYYGDATLPEVKEPSYWNNPSEAEKNLIYGLRPYVSSKDPFSNDLYTEYYNSKQNLYLLTDGIYAQSTSYPYATLAHFTRGAERTLVYDLKHTSAVSGVNYSFLQDRGPAVNLPTNFSVSVSEDGIGWQRVYLDQNLVLEKDTGFFRKTVKFDGVYRARFVKIRFSVGTHVFCDELQVTGTTAIPANAKTPVPGTEEETVDAIGYTQPDALFGVDNVMLSYNCIEEDRRHSENGLITVEEYLPYVGYYNTDGELIDTFFDGFLYLPYAVYSRNPLVWSLEGWNFYLDDIYMKDRNMDALNTAVAQVKGELHKPDYQCTVFTSILYPWKTLKDSTAVNPFGDVDGDGINESFDSVENRIKAVRWMMKQEYDRFVEGNYENLKFGGFYWFEEELVLNSADEKALVNAASEYAHELGFKLIWIPYFCASGFDGWREYGIDVACMQPNYMFTGNPDPAILKTTAEKTEQLGMCVEMEMNDINNIEEVNRYMEYLQAGVKYGYMNAIKMYYQGGVPGAFYHAYQAKTPYERSLYDLTYLYAKRKLTLDLPEYTLQTEPYIVKNGRLSGKKIATSETPYRIELAVSPEHGSLNLSSDGKFTYYADADYTGTDRFSVILNFGYCKTEELIVTVHVE